MLVVIWKSFVVASRYGSECPISCTLGVCLFATRLSVHCVHGGMRQAPECLVPGHISVRSQELLKAEKRRFYRCSPFAEICPGAFPTYNTAGRREAIVSTCSPLLSRFMIKVSTQSAVNLVGILVAYPGQSPIKLLSPLLFTEQRSRESIISYVS